MGELEGGMYEGSALGTKEYWDSAYVTELANFGDSEGADCGEVWFGEDSMERMLDFLHEVLQGRGVAPEQCTVLDVGCGNGVLMCELSKCGFGGMVGSDYSAHSVDLTRRVMEGCGAMEGNSVVEDDITNSRFQDKQFNCVLDKGVCVCDGEKNGHKVFK